MPIEKKHIFKGLDLRTNVLSREDGTASDTSNVLLDGSTNLIKRNELKKLNFPFGDGDVGNGFNPVTELHPDAKVLDVIEYPYGGRTHDQTELLLFVYLELEMEAAPGNPSDVFINKLYRVTDLNTDPISIEEIPMQTWNSLPLYVGFAAGRANPFMVAIDKNVNYILINKSLYISGEAKEGQTIDFPGIGTLNKPDVAPSLKYDGEVWHSSGVVSLGLPHTEETADIPGGTDKYYAKLVNYYVDAKGVQHYREDESIIVDKHPSFASYTVPCVLNSAFNSDEDLISSICGSHTTRGGFFTSIAPYPIFPPYSPSNPQLISMDDPSISSYFPLVFTSDNCQIVEGSWVYTNMASTQILLKMRVSKITQTVDDPLDSSNNRWEVEVDDMMAFEEGNWVHKYGQPVMSASIMKNDTTLVTVLSGEVTAAYFSKKATFDFKCCGAASVNQNTFEAYSLTLPIIKGTYTPQLLLDKGEYNNLTTDYYWGMGSTFIGVWEDSVFSFFPSYMGEAPINSRVTTSKYEDFYPEALSLTNMPPMGQIVRLGDRVLCHDGRFVYMSYNNGVLISPEVCDPFANISVGDDRDGPIKNVWVSTEYAIINREKKSYLLAGSILTGNFSVREIQGDNFGSVSPTAITNMGNSPIFVSRNGIFLNEGQLRFTPIGLPIDPAIVKDSYDIGIDLSKTTSFTDPVNRRVYFSFTGSKGSFALMYDYLHSQWFKMDGLPHSLKINEEGKMIGTDGEHLFIESDTYDTGVDAFYKSNYLVAGEPSLKKQWHKLIMFLVGSPVTEIGFDSSEDWGKGTSEADCSDTLVVKDKYVVDMKSFAPSDSYSRTIEIESKGKNKLLVNGYQVTFDFVQDDPVDENEDNE